MPIASIAVHTTPEIKSYLDNFQIAVGRAKWGEAAEHLANLRSAIVRHNTSRGQSPKAEIEILDQMYYWIDRKVTTWGKQNEVMRLVVDLQKALVLPLPGDPIAALSVICEGLQDAWRAFILDKTPRNADVVDEQLRSIQQLKPKFEEKFKDKSPAVYAGFRRLVELANSCSSNVFISLQPSYGEKLQIGVVNSFTELFKQIGSLLVPENYEARQATPERPRLELG